MEEEQQQQTDELSVRPNYFWLRPSGCLMGFLMAKINRFDLETLGSRPIFFPIFPGHTDSHPISYQIGRTSTHLPPEIKQCESVSFGTVQARKPSTLRSITLPMKSVVPIMSPTDGSDLLKTLESTAIWWLCRNSNYRRHKSVHTMHWLNYTKLGRINTLVTCIVLLQCGKETTYPGTSWHCTSSHKFRFETRVNLHCFHCSKLRCLVYWISIPG